MKPLRKAKVTFTVNTTYIELDANFNRDEYQTWKTEYGFFVTTEELELLRMIPEHTFQKMLNENSL